MLLLWLKPLPLMTISGALRTEFAEGHRKMSVILVFVCVKEKRMKKSKSPPFIDATKHLHKRSCPSVCQYVRPTVRPSVPCYFRKTNTAIFEGNRLSNHIIINDTMSDDEGVASDVPIGPSAWPGHSPQPSGAFSQVNKLQSR